MPKEYGSPTFQPPGRIHAARPKAAPASPEEIHRRLDAYEQHLKQEHARLQYVRKVVPRGSSAGAIGGQKAPPMRVEKALKDAGG
jgi:hypothetical protein